MRILIAQNARYYPSHGGGDKSNRLLAEALAARGHDCRVISRPTSPLPDAHENYLEELAARFVKPRAAGPDAIVFDHHGVEAHAIKGNADPRGYLASQISAFDPAVILSSTDDPSQRLLEIALEAEIPRVVYLARATLALPFGPDCAFPNPERISRLRQVDAVVGVSRYVADYFHKWASIESSHVPISLMEPGPYPDLGRFENEFVTLVNPCAVKGISIFLELAARMPDVRFAAVPMWGTNAKDVSSLQNAGNIQLLDPVDDIDELLSRTRVLLVPSLWAEARSRIVVEAMLRGVPVIASDVGGIPEAMMGMDYLLPVRPIEKYHSILDERMMPAPEIPDQNIEPWLEALKKLLSDVKHYESLSRASRAAASSYVAGLSARPFEELLEQVASRTKRRLTLETVPAEPDPDARTRLQELSRERRELFELLVRKKTSKDRAGARAWFPSIEEPAPRLRLFCFPHAGGGSLAFQGWRLGLPYGAAPCPARLPGRESRLSESPFLRMDELVETLANAIAPFLGTPFAFFGHSMGAAVAFELARCLRRRTQRLPACLFVSGARAPQFRLGHVAPAEPSESELLAQVKRLEGIPSEALENLEAMRIILPALQADATLYRNYAYLTEPPLACAIRAYGGAEDPNVGLEHLEAWRAQTLGSFRVRLFPGRHFYLKTEEAAFLEALSADLDEILAIAPRQAL